MIPAPTSPGRAFEDAAHPTLTAALDRCAAGDTGISLYGLRGELVEVLTYADLRARALAAVGALQAAGLRRGETVGLVAETSAEFICAFFACQYSGLVPATLPLPTPLGGVEAYVDQLARLLRAAQAAAVFGPPTLASRLAEAGRQGGVRIAATRLADLPQGEGAPQIPGPDDPCYLMFSSGSTRDPAGVLITQGALAANARAMSRDGLKVTAADRAVSWLPLYHDMGLVGFLLSPVFSATSVDLMPTEAFARRPLLWLGLMSRNGGTISCSPTFGYELCARRGEAADTTGLDLSPWRAAGIGGDMVRAAPLKAFARCFAGAGFSEGAYAASYGLAEATLGVTMAPLGAGLETERLAVDRLERQGLVEAAQDGERARAFVSCGPVLPGHELEIRDARGRRLPERTVGRIFVRGPSLMRGYHRQPQATAEALSTDGWLDTGDLGFLSEGALTPTGRSKDLILFNGRNIWPQDLEWTAEAEVAELRSGDVAAFGLQGGDDEAQIVTLVQTRTSDPAARTRLADDVAALLRARHGVEATVRLVGAHALPQTPSGKLRRSKARELYLAGAFA